MRCARCYRHTHSGRSWLHRGRRHRHGRRHRRGNRCHGGWMGHRRRGWRHRVEDVGIPVASRIDASPPRRSSSIWRLVDAPREHLPAPCGEVRRSRAIPLDGGARRSAFPGAPGARARRGPRRCGGRLPEEATGIRLSSSMERRVHLVLDSRGPLRMVHVESQAEYRATSATGPGLAEGAGKGALARREATAES